MSDFHLNSKNPVEVQNLRGDLQELIDAISKEGGGKLVFHQGIYQTGPLELKDGVSLHLSKEAILRFSDNFEDFPTIQSRWEGIMQELYMPCLYANHAKNIGITGSGTIDGSGLAWWKLFRESPQDLKFPRPKLIGFENSENIVLKDFRAINSPCWTISPLLCQNVLIDAVKIKNPTDSPNTDGIDPESCKNVTIRNCQIDVGDDCIALKSGKEGLTDNSPCEDIEISDCLMRHGHGAVVFGSEMSGGIRNVEVRNCKFIGTDRGIRFKSRPGRGGVIENISFDDIEIRDSICPIVMNLNYSSSSTEADDKLSGKDNPTLRKVRIRNVTANGVTTAAVFIFGLEKSPVEDVKFENIKIAMSEKAVEPQLPAMIKDAEALTKQAIIISQGKNIEFENIEITGFEGSLLTERNTENIIITKEKI